MLSALRALSVSAAAAAAVVASAAAPLAAQAPAATPTADAVAGFVAAPLTTGATTTLTAPRRRLERVPGDSTQRIRIEVAAGPLVEALETFERQTGMRVELATLIDPSVRTAGVDGSMTAPTALRALLAGTGFSARITSADRVVVRRAAEGDTTGAVVRLDRVVVTAAAGRPSGYAVRRTSSATKTDTPLRDVPQSVTVIGRQLLADQSAQSMGDVVRYVPGITMGQGEGHRDAPTIRGQSSTADFFVDGVRDDAQYLRDLYNVERVEALKGANAMTFGRGGGGGVINRVNRAAQWTPTRSIMLEGGSFDHRRSTLDVGQGFGGAFAGRLNAMLEDSRNFRGNNHLERQGVNPTASILARGALVQLGFEHFADRRTVDRGVPSFKGAPSRVDVATFFGDPGASRARATVNAGSVMIERALGATGIRLRNRTQIAGYDKSYQNVYPNSAVSGGRDSLSTGDDSLALAGYRDRADRRNLFNQLDAIAEIGTGRLVRQTLLVGAEVGRQRTVNLRQSATFGGSTSLRVPLSDPTVAAGAVFAWAPGNADNRAVTRVAGVYAQDQIAIGSHLQLVGGVRYDQFAIDFRNNRAATPAAADLHRVDRMVSPRAGIVLKPVERLSVYGTNSVSFLPSSGDQFSSLTVTTQTLAPERFTNREAGVKWDVRPDLAITGAVFRLDRTNTSAPDPLDVARIVQTGAQRTTGAEAGITGSISSRWQVAGGWATQNARIVSKTSAARAGARVPLTPRNTVSLWNRVQLARVLGAGVGVVHQDRMYAAIDNSVELPAFTRVDAAAFVTLSRTLRAQLNVENLLDRRYYSTSHGNNNIMPGASRTLRLSVTATP